MSSAITRKTQRSQTTVPSVFSLDPFNALRSEFDHLLSTWFNDREKSVFTTHIPSLDLEETDKSYEVRIDLPGIKPGEFNLQFSDNVLTVSGERHCDRCDGKTAEKKTGGKPHQIERFHGSFSRSVVLPGSVDQEHIEAEYVDGVLKVTLPKAEHVKPRQISIKS